MAKETISEYTEAEFLAFVNDLCDFSKRSERATDALVSEFERLTEHPDGSDIIFYPPDDREDTPVGIVNEVKRWRAENGKSGFKVA